MKKLEFQKPYKLSAVIQIISEAIIQNGISNNLSYEYMNFYLYTKDDVKIASEDTICYIESYPEIDDNDREIYPNFVISERLEVFCSGNILEDVISNLFHQKNSPAIKEFVTALNYYFANDAFLKI